MINNRYIIRNKLGEGRSQVFHCYDSAYPSKKLAIKILTKTDDAAELSLFRNEYITLKKLNHNHIVKAYDFGDVLKIDDEDSARGIDVESKFITLDYFEGNTLLDYPQIKDESHLKRIVKQISSVLYYLHQSNYIYYDIKPENILVEINGGKPEIKFIDFGLAKYLPEQTQFEAKGTASYIAPEILKLEQVDHRADLYSLGILLYRIVYDRFPFDTNNQISIYKAQIEKEFDFPSLNYTDDFRGVIQKLLQKNPDDRYSSSLKILGDLNIGITKQLKQNWRPIKTFYGQDKALVAINSIIRDETSQDIIIIKGKEGAGKSTFLEELYYNNDRAILIDNYRLNSDRYFWKTLLSTIFYSKPIFNNTDEFIKKEIFRLLRDDSSNVMNDLKSVFFHLSQENKFLLLLDDFDRYDDLTTEILKEIIPILQVNDIKIVITESTGLPEKSKFIVNRQIYNMTPLPVNLIEEFIGKSFFDLFPKAELTGWIKDYVDLLPGNVIGFINNLISLEILDFRPEGPFLKKDPSSLELIKSHQEKIYGIRVGELSRQEFKTLQTLSLFSKTLAPEVISKLLNIAEPELENILTGLRELNLIHEQNESYNPRFISSGFKNFIYKNIPDAEILHNEFAGMIENNFEDFDKMELAGQYQLAKNYDKCYSTLKKELYDIEKISAAAYQRRILEHLIVLPLDAGDKLDAEILLCKIYYKLSEYKLCFELIEKLFTKPLDADTDLELSILKGKCLIDLGEFNEGLELLNSYLKSIDEESEKQSILTDIANAELYLNKFDTASEISGNVISDENSSGETKGKAYNLLGLVELYRNNNLDKTISYFENALKMFEESGLPVRISGMELNIGNIYQMMGNIDKAIKHWRNSQKINRQIGNLDHEAKFLLNYGIYNFDNTKFENSVQHYTRAKNIFSSLGNKYGFGLALINLGEAYLNMCEYQNSIESLQQSRNIFKSIGNKEEEAESIFLTAQLYFQLGNFEIFELTADQYGSLVGSDGLVEKHSYNLTYLNMLRAFHNRHYKMTDKFAKEIIVSSFKYNDREARYYLYKTVLVTAYGLIERKKNNEAFGMLTDKDYLEFVGNNILFEAERQYILGIISGNIKTGKLSPPIDYYERADELMKNQSVNELTWKINYAISEYYYERGNYTKAADYIHIANSIVNFLAGNIHQPNLRQAYLNTHARSKVMEKFRNYEEHIN